MAVYLVNIALIIFWRLYFTQKNFQNARKYYCAIVALQWILISGLRDWNIGDDTYAYYLLFEQAKLTSWNTLLKNLFGYIFQNVAKKDPGYTVIMKLLQTVSGSYQLFLLAIAGLFMSLMAVWIYRYSSSPCTSFILFSTLFYSFYAVTGHRQTIATALIVFWGYELIRKRHFGRFFVVAAVAFLIHKSSLVFIPMYFLLRIPVTFGYKILLVTIIIAVALLGKDLYAPIAYWIGYGESMIDYEGGGAGLYATLLVLLCIVVWILYPRIKQHRNDADMLFHINSVALMTGLLVFHNQSFMRIQQYFSLFLMITIPEVINTIKREYRLLGYLLFGAVMILYLMRNNPQYQFFFVS